MPQTPQHISPRAPAPRRLVPLAALLLVGCGSRLTVVKPPATKPAVTVQGSVVRFPVDSDPVDYSGLTVGLYNATDLIQNANAVPLVQAALAVGGCAADGCPFTFTGVDLEQVEQGLLVAVKATAGAVPGAWQDAFTGVADANTVTTAWQTQATLTLNPAFALHASGYAALAGTTGVAADALLARGVLVGWVLGKRSEQAAGTPQPPTLAGVGVHAATQDPVDTWFPNATLTGVSGSAATDTNGLFITAPQQPQTLVTFFSLTAPSGDTAHHWPTTLAGSQPGDVLILPFVASP